MAPAAELYVGKILGRQQEWKAIRAGLAWALELKVDVVNLSWAAHASDPECDEILNDLNTAGVIVVAACNPYLHWPHSRPTVIAAGLRGSPADYDIPARGEAQVLRNGRLEAFCGPSVASANVAGMAACAKAFDKSIDRELFLTEFSVTPRGCQPAGLDYVRRL